MLSARRFAGPVRGVGLVLIGVFGLLAVPEESAPLGLALFTLVLIGAAVDCWAGPRDKAAPLVLTFAVARAAALCATQEWTDGQQWAINSLTTTAITLFWEWPPKVAIPVTAGLLAVELVAAGDGTVVLRLVLECLLARLGYLLLRRSSRRVDELRAKQATLKREEAIAKERRAQEQEYLALLHDTASTTFLLVAVHGHHTEPDRVAEYARHDLALLTESGHDSPVDLRTSLQAVVDRSPLAVDVRWRGSAPVPAKVALALVRAVREALANIERHAGVATATLDVDDHVVAVADSGSGFRPDDVPSSRRGLRGSVIERMAAAGGSATVTSRPGAGTTVRLEWPHG